MSTASILLWNSGKPVRSAKIAHSPKASGSGLLVPVVAKAASCWRNWMVG